MFLRCSTAAALSLLGVSACSTHVTGVAATGGGTVVPRPAEPAGGATAFAGVGHRTGYDDTFGVDLSAVARVTPSAAKLGVGEGAFLLARYGLAHFLFRGGPQLDFELRDARLLVGGGAYGSAAVALTLRRDGQARTMLTFGPLAELTGRFSRPRAEALLGLAVGLLWTGPERDAP